MPILTTRLSDAHSKHVTKTLYSGALCDEYSLLLCYCSSKRIGTQWNLRTRDTLGLTVLFLEERLSLSLGGKIIHQSISMVPKQVSFVERSSPSQRVPYRRFHCILCVVG